MLDSRYPRPLTGNQCLVVALACFGLLALLLCLSCSTDPQDGSGAACGRQALPGAQPPPLTDVREAMDLGFAQAALTCPTAANDPARPDVRWFQGDFWIANGNNVPGGAGHGVCASGACFGSDNQIWVSLAEPDRVLALVTWESRNMAWYRANCKGQMF